MSPEHPISRSSDIVAEFEPVPFHSQPATRMRAADYVFESLSRAILTGQLAPGTELAPQRELAQQFNVSPLVVRQATHRLESLGLVRVRQGSTTTVLDPDEASDIRLMQLQLELATTGDRLSLAASESQALSVLPILALAQRRITEAELSRLEAIVDQVSEDVGCEPVNFLVEFWGVIAHATHNAVVQRQVSWWANVAQELARRRNSQASGRRRLPNTVYRGLIRTLRRRHGAPEYWLKLIGPLFDWTEAQPNHVVNDARAKPPRT